MTKAQKKAAMQADGWRVEHDPYRRFVNGGRHLLPNDRLSDADAWAKLYDYVQTRDRND